MASQPAKYSRLMYEHDTFKRLKDMSGAGWNSEIQAPTLSDEVWENLSKDRSHVTHRC
ncbi:hypothetical protein GQ600_12668 [Phytophthora cactorum]|nr:hypothetical protein GQ600_12668 [Phytophthora cactorum]